MQKRLQKSYQGTFRMAEAQIKLGSVHESTRDNAAILFFLAAQALIITRGINCIKSMHVAVILGSSKGRGNRDALEQDSALAKAAALLKAHLFYSMFYAINSSRYDESLRS